MKMKEFNLDTEVDEKQVTEEFKIWGWCCLHMIRNIRLGTGWEWRRCWFGLIEFEGP
jgi:hypothetical protein